MSVQWLSPEEVLSRLQQSNPDWAESGAAILQGVLDAKKGDKKPEVRETPFGKNFRVKTAPKGPKYTGSMQDAINRHMCFRDGKRVECQQFGGQGQGWGQLRAEEDLYDAMRRLIDELKGGKHEGWHELLGLLAHSPPEDLAALKEQHGLSAPPDVKQALTQRLQEELMHVGHQVEGAQPQQPAMKGLVGRKAEGESTPKEPPKVPEAPEQREIPQITSEPQAEEGVVEQETPDVWKETYAPKINPRWNVIAGTANEEERALAEEEFSKLPETERQEQNVLEYARRKQAEEHTAADEWRQTWEANYKKADAILESWKEEPVYQPIVEHLDRAFEEVEEWRRRPYKTAFVISVTNFPRQSILKITQSVREIRFFNTISEVSVQAARSMIQAYEDPEVVNRYRISPKQVEKAVEDYKRIMQNAVTDPKESSFFHGLYSRIYFDSPTIPKGMEQNSTSQYELGSGDFDRMLGIYTHELSHAFDWNGGNKFSDQNSWEDAWHSEISGGNSKEWRLTNRARANPREGFAEFARVLFAGNVPRQKIEEEFPACSRFFRECGLWQD